MSILFKTLRILATLVVGVVALIAGVALWHHYMLAPWTRDGRVRAEVVSVAPEISGPVKTLAVADNQPIHKGDVLFTIDPERFELALAQAQAVAESRRAGMQVAQTKFGRRARLGDLAASTEEKEQYGSDANVARANFDEAIAEVNIAKLNLAKTVIRSPVNGYVTNLRLRVGDFATAGQTALVVVDSDSFWVAGYFEETKLKRVRPGAAVTVELMGYDRSLKGHVESMSRGIADQNGNAGEDGLAAVNPVFTWVRLAQRVPIRVHIDTIPAGVELAAGLTCSVIVDGERKFADDVRAALRLLRSTLAGRPAWD
jgi:multidrug resistance efflux pump